jgi:hypothetical protein
MRSELVYSANTKISNRFLLATVAIKAVRRLHITSTRTEDTANKVLADVASGSFVEIDLPVIKPIVPIEPFFVTPAA